MKFRKINNNNSGFTLFELMVSMSIILALSLIFIVNFKDFNEKGKLEAATQEVVGVIRRVQNYAMASRVDSTGYVPAGGWGLRFNHQAPRDIIIFADDGDQSYANSEKIETIELPADIKIKIVYTELDSDSTLNQECRYVNFIYEPPRPTIHLRKDGNEGSVCNSGNSREYSNRSEIVLINTATGEESTILVNIMGLISVLN